MGLSYGQEMSNARGNPDMKKFHRRLPPPSPACIQFKRLIEARSFQMSEKIEQMERELEQLKQELAAKKDEISRQANTEAADERAIPDVSE
jgi:hypothetical protein